MNVTEIKKFIEENKENQEVKVLLDSFKVGEEPSLEVFKIKVETDAEFKSFMDSEKDKHHSKALETWKANNLDTIVDEKIKELYPEEDPKDLEVKKLKQEMETIKNERIREQMTNLALKKANELNIPTDLVDFFVAGDKETTLANIERFSDKYTEGIQTTVKAKLEGNGDVVPKGSTINSISKEDLEEMSYTERDKLYKTNKSLYDELTNEER